jgi:hypothetical protein
MTSDWSEIDDAISPEEQDWLIRKAEHLTQLTNDTVPDDRLPALSHWPVALLDLDDVLCINDLVGGEDAVAAVRGKTLDPDGVYDRLWAPAAAQAIEQVVSELDGKVRFVISSTWKRLLTRSELREVLSKSGLVCVAERLELLTRWCTPIIHGGTRAQEIIGWLSQHHSGEPYVILDDAYSGPDLLTYRGRGSQLLSQDRIVLCDERVGLLPTHVSRIVQALRTPPFRAPRRAL